MAQKRVVAVRPSTDGRPKNQLLAALPADDFRRLRPHLKTVPIRVKQVLHTRGKPLDAVYFLNGGVASITTTLSDGTRMEAATVGHEGVLGIDAFLSADAVAAGDTLVQVPDTNAERLDIHHFRRELAHRGALHHLMGHYAHVFIAQMIQTSACNARHQVPQRCARWLLMAHDRMQEHDFTLSHEVLAVMLGARRPTVSAVAATLQEAGLIRYVHGHMTVLDRKRLERASCECYSIIRAHFARLRTMSEQVV
jgi:CRP-like cAMP-binding protein